MLLSLVFSSAFASLVHNAKRERAGKEQADSKGTRNRQQAKNKQTVSKQQANDKQTANQSQTNSKQTASKRQRKSKQTANTQFTQGRARHVRVGPPASKEQKGSRQTASKRQTNSKQTAKKHQTNSKQRANRQLSCCFFALALAFGLLSLGFLRTLSVLFANPGSGRSHAS